MTFRLSAVSLATLTSLAYTQAYADTTYDAKSVVSDDQLSSIVKSMLKIAPNGTKATNLLFSGFFSVNDDRYMTLLDSTSIKFKVTTKIGIIPLSSDIVMSLAGSFPTLDCNNPQITRVVVDGNSVLLDGPIRDHVKNNVVSIFRDNFVAQTDLVKYCKVKPVPQTTTFDSPFEFTLELADDNYLPSV